MKKRTFEEMITEVENGTTSGVKEEIKELTPNELVQMYTKYAEMHSTTRAVQKMDILTR